MIGDSGVGKTKVFLRDGALDDIERVRAVVCFDLAARLQAHGRGYLGKKYYRKVLRALLSWQVRRPLAENEFFELLALRTPFAAETMAELTARVRASAEFDVRAAPRQPGGSPRASSARRLRTRLRRRTTILGRRCWGPRPR